MKDNDERERRDPGAGPRAPTPGDPFWWLRDRDAFLRRFVLSEALGEPRARRPQPGHRPPRGGR